MKKKAELKTVVIYKPVADGRAHHEAALEAVADGLVEWLLSGAGLNSSGQQERLGGQMLHLELSQPPGDR